MKKKWEKDGTKRKVVLFVCSWWGKSASEIHGSAANSRIIFQGNSTRINPLNPRVREGKHARKLLVSVAGLRRCWISSSYLFFFFFYKKHLPDQRYPLFTSFLLNISLPFSSDSSCSEFHFLLLCGRKTCRSTSFFFCFGALAGTGIRLRFLRRHVGLFERSGLRSFLKEISLPFRQSLILCFGALCHAPVVINTTFAFSCFAPSPSSNGSSRRLVPDRFSLNSRYLVYVIDREKWELLQGLVQRSTLWQDLVRYSYNADRKLLSHARITQIAELFKGERNIRIIKINKTQDNSRNSQ